MNRVDAVIVFHALTRLHIQQIVALEVGKVNVRLADHGLSLRLTEAACDYLADKGFDPHLGARPLRRVIQAEVEDALSEEVLAGRFGTGQSVVGDLVDGKLAFVPDGSEGGAPPEESAAPEAAEVSLS
jgi:ATP-dependent Clp protease ATP-binding subunit ClpA